MTGHTFLAFRFSTQADKDSSASAFAFAECRFMNTPGNHEGNQNGTWRTGGFEWRPVRLEGTSVLTKGKQVNGCSSYTSNLPWRPRRSIQQVVQRVILRQYRISIRCLQDNPGKQSEKGCGKLVREISGHLENWIPLNSFAEIFGIFMKVIQKKFNPLHLRKSEHINSLGIKITLSHPALSSKSFTILEERKTRRPSHSTKVWILVHENIWQIDIQFPHDNHPWSVREVCALLLQEVPGDFRGVEDYHWGAEKMNIYDVPWIEIVITLRSYTIAYDLPNTFLQEAKILNEPSKGTCLTWPMKGSPGGPGGSRTCLFRTFRA